VTSATWLYNAVGPLFGLRARSLTALVNSVPAMLRDDGLGAQSWLVAQGLLCYWLVVPRGYFAYRYRWDPNPVTDPGDAWEEVSKVDDDVCGYLGAAQGLLLTLLLVALQLQGFGGPTLLLIRLGTIAVGELLVWVVAALLWRVWTVRVVVS
jgi:hypothetical protein